MLIKFAPTNQSKWPFMNLKYRNLVDTSYSKIHLVFSATSIGLLLMVSLFCLTWTFAVPSFIRDTESELPDFYPAFQVRTY